MKKDPVTPEMELIKALAAQVINLIKTIHAKQSVYGENGELRGQPQSLGNPTHLQIQRERNEHAHACKRLRKHINHRTRFKSRGPVSGIRPKMSKRKEPPS